MGCHTCTICLRHQEANAFAANSTECIACSNKGLCTVCDACQEEKEAAAFDKDVLNNAAKHGRKRVCLACCVRGFTPRDVDSYRCIECEDKGHTNVDRQSLKDATSRAFVDDIGTFLNALYQIPTIHASFALFQRVSNLALKPKKCVVVPLGAPPTTERAQLVRDYITKYAPSWCSFNITDVAEYLLFLLGPKGGITS